MSYDEYENHSVLTACLVLPKMQKSGVPDKGPVLLRFLFWPGSDYFLSFGVKRS